MLFTKLKNAREKHSILSQCDILGSFDFYSTIVSLDSVEQKDLEDAASHQTHLKDVFEKKSKLDLAVFKKLKAYQPLAHHEYTHFVDSTSTLWGIKYLDLMAKAYSSDDRRFGGKEPEFCYAKHFHDLLRFVKLPSYFTFQSPVENTSRPWVFKESIGNRFSNNGEVSDHPIIFTQFGNTKGELIVRSPISTLSILECAAMAQEVSCTIGLILQLEDGVRDVEMQLYAAELLNYLYDRELTEYSVCAHLLSNNQTNIDIALTFKASAIVCRYILNTPFKIYKKIAETANLSSIFGPGTAEWVDKIAQGLHQNEPGFLYYLICNQLPKGCLESTAKTIAGIKVALSNLNIDIDDLKAEAALEFESYVTSIDKSKIEHIKKISKSSKKNFNIIDWDIPFLPFDELDLPPALLGDSTSINLLSGDNNNLASLDLETLFDEMFEGQAWVERFVEACA
jgi:hypothetical protein